MATIIAVQPKMNGTNPPIVLILAPPIASIESMVLTW
jgi:hypothetical protein